MGRTYAGAGPTVDVAGTSDVPLPVWRGLGVLVLVAAFLREVGFGKGLEAHVTACEEWGAAQAHVARGHTLVEVMVASGLVLLLGALASALMSAGTRTAKQSFTNQTANDVEVTTLDAIADDLKLADATTIVYSSADPGAIGFQKVVGYDTATKTRILSAPITYSVTPIPDAPDRMVVRRTVQADVATFGGGVNLEDADDPLLPGLNFDVRTTSAGTFVDIALTAWTGGADDTAFRRLATTVRVRND